MKVKEYLTESSTKWTENLPKRKGWYWIKNVEGGEVFIRYFNGKYIEGTARHETPEEFTETIGSTNRSRLWAGPIPEPRF